MKNIKNMIFDLDETLYPINPQIEEKFVGKMLEFFRGKMNIEVNDFDTHMKKWKEEYGSDINAVSSMGIDPEYFMNYVCDIDMSSIEYNENLEKKLKKLPHRKFIYTNSTKGHVDDVLHNLGVKDVFTDVFTIKESDFILKPDIKSFNSFFERYKINPKETVMFEDNLKNLKIAKDIGMTTVLISNNNEKYSHVDYICNDINEALDLFAE